MSSAQLLSTFQNTKPTQIFKTTPTTPQFFKTHLVDPLRIIKILKDDPNASERVFYYQYLKLCTTAQGYPDIRTQNLRIILQNPQFYFIFPTDCNNKHYTDEKFKSLALQFLDLLPQNMGKLDQLLSRFPVVDLVMVYMMRSLLIINGIAQQSEQFVDKNDVLSVLSKILDVQYQCYGQCVKFGESDVFLLQQSPFQIYMAYLKPKQQDPPKQLLIPKLTTKKSSKKERNELYKSNTSNQCYQFVDYTGLGVERLPTAHTNLFQSENLSLKSPTRSMLKNKQTNDNKFPVFQPFKEVAEIREADIMTVDGKDKSRVQDEVQQFYEESDEQVMNVDVSEQTSRFPQTTENKKQQQVEDKAGSQKNRDSGYESEQDEPKYKIRFPGAIQKQERASSTEVEQSRMQDHGKKPQTREQLDKQQQKSEQLETKKMQNPEQQKQFSFKNKAFKPQAQQIESTDKMREQNQSNNDQRKGNDRFQVKVDLHGKQQKYLDESNRAGQASKNSYMNNGATSAAILSSISITPYSYNNHNSTSAFYPSIPASNSPPYTPSTHHSYHSYQDPNKYNQLDHKYTVKKSIPSFMDIIQNTSTSSNTHLGSRQLPWQRTGGASGQVGNPQIRLNVTKQFTNSFIMKQMPESYREGVKKARERARVYRKTLMSSHQ